MSDQNTTDKKQNRKLLITLVNSLLIVCVICAIVWGISTYFNLDTDVYTNDAQVEEYINPINVRIPGYIKQVKFEEHQQVKKGDTLVLIDDREYKIQVEQAEAAYLAAQAAKTVTSSSVNTVQSNIGITDANIKAAEARVWNAKQNYNRYEALLKEGAATQQQFDQVKTEYDALLAQTLALKRQRNTTSLSTSETSKRVDINEADIKRTHAALDLAKLNLSYTIITAPYDGVTGRRNVQEGQLVQAGQNMLSFVRNGNKWVVANYKETQIGKIHIGAKVRLKIDGLDDKEMMGKVVAISQATGSRYSAIPVDNSTGNFVKVQQRIPVKIELLPGKADDVNRLIAGMNVEVRLAN
ncbi:HlyD family secretion protein [Mucilaginibacter angelicae]|uniref:HlyD family secretion protein n=1 Tax=Mucilaginibacter angelicae TaxID=869718 RepID=A0ABV6L249_9SPHI